MLTFLLGRSHSGKTQQVLARLAALPQTSGPAYLLLPDQSTFEGERRCYRTLGAKAFARVQVTGFSRLASRLVERYHPQGRPAADSRQKLLLMQLALEEAGPLLTVYASQASRSRLAPDLLQTVEQLQSAGLDPAGVEAFAHTLPEGTLRSKLLDTARVYAGYQGLLGQRFSDPLENLPRAARLARDGWRGVFLHRAVDRAKLTHATVPELKEILGLDAESLAAAVRKAAERNEKESTR